MTVPIYEATAGVLLVFVLPGLTVAKAVFPEWRIRGPDPIRSAVVLATLSLVLSVALTVLVGFGLLNLGPSGFQATWNDPELEATLAGVSVVGFVAGWLRGAYARVAPSVASVSEPRGEEGAWELQRELDRLARQSRRLTHALRVSLAGSPEAARLQREIEEVEAQRLELRRRRQGEYAD